MCQSRLRSGLRSARWLTILKRSRSPFFHPGGNNSEFFSMKFDPLLKTTKQKKRQLFQSDHLKCPNLFCRHCTFRNLDFFALPFIFPVLLRCKICRLRVERGPNIKKIFVVFRRRRFFKAERKFPLFYNVKNFGTVIRVRAVIHNPNRDWDRRFFHPIQTLLGTQGITVIFCSLLWIVEKHLKLTEPASERPKAQNPTLTVHRHLG